MLLTEDEAKTKQCRAWPPAVIGDKFHYQIAPSTCAASGCMHWRWGTPKLEIVTTQPDGGSWRALPAMGDGVQRWSRLVAKRGFCGLAGEVRYLGDGS
jgi:hypothetical protein